MNKKTRLIFILSILSVFLIAGFIIFIMIKDSDNKIGKNNKEVFLNRETVRTMISKFNTEVMDSGMEYPASDDYLLRENNLYYYGLQEGITLYIEPNKYTGNLETDIVKQMGIVYDKGEKESIGFDYVKHLIKANNYNLNEDKIKDIINNANELGKNNSGDTGTGYKKEGLLVAYWPNDETYHYSVQRMYED